MTWTYEPCKTYLGSVNGTEMTRHLSAGIGWRRRWRTPLLCSVGCPPSVKPAVLHTTTPCGRPALTRNLPSCCGRLLPPLPPNYPTSNASDALDKLRFLSVTEPELVARGGELAIRIRTDPEAGTITIRWGRDHHQVGGGGGGRRMKKRTRKLMRQHRITA